MPVFEFNAKVSGWCLESKESVLLKVDIEGGSLESINAVVGFITDEMYRAC